MAPGSLRGLSKQMRQLVTQTDDAGKRLTCDKDMGVFNLHRVSLDCSRVTAAEAGFVRAVSWFYVLYFETGRVSVEFLSEKLDAFGLDANREKRGIVSTVQQLRTSFQHNLDQTRSEDRAKKEYCEAWFRGACGVATPSSAEKWRLCLAVLLAQCDAFVRSLRACVALIGKNESRDLVLQQWRFRIARHHPPHEFDDLVFLVAQDMGCEHLDPASLRKRYYDRWNDRLRLLTGDYDFATEARRLIEDALLDDIGVAMPLDGRDIMREFDVEPGPRVGELLRLAKSIYAESPCSAAELIVRLRPTVLRDAGA